MKTTRIMAVAVLIAASGLALHVARAQQSGIKRTDLQRHDLSAPGREVVYVLEGSLEYEVEGKAPVTLKAGDVLFIPA